MVARPIWNAEQCGHSAGAAFNGLHLRSLRPQDRSRHKCVQLGHRGPYQSLLSELPHVHVAAIAPDHFRCWDLQFCIHFW